MCGIDIEVEDGCEGNYTKIYHNLIKNVKGGSIMCYAGNHVDIYENTVYQWITQWYSRDITVYNNTLYNSWIDFKNPDYGVKEYSNNRINE